MLDFNLFFKQKMTRFATLFFATMLLIANIGFFISSIIQYNLEIDRQRTSFVTMIEHLIASEDMTSAIIYLEHYNHTHGVELIYVDPSGMIRYQSQDDASNMQMIPLYDLDGQFIGSISIDFQKSALNRELFIGLLGINVFSLILFSIGLLILYRYLDDQNKMIQKDMSRVGIDEADFTFKDIHSINIRYLKALNAEKELKEKEAHYIKVLAHDLKTPLTVMNAYLEGIKQKRIKLDDQITDDLMNEIKAIEGIIPKMIQNDMHELVFHQNIKEIIEQQIVKLSILFNKRRIVIENRLENLYLYVSAHDITRIVEQLMMNSYYYSKDGTKIKITLLSDSNKLIIQDEGIGMNDQTLMKIRNGLYRTEAAKKMYALGSGIGLSIVYAIIEKLNASLKVESKPDCGTTITIVFK